MAGLNGATVSVVKHKCNAHMQFCLHVFQLKIVSGRMSSLFSAPSMLENLGMFCMSDVSPFEKEESWVWMYSSHALDFGAHRPSLRIVTLSLPASLRAHAPPDCNE